MSEEQNKKRELEQRLEKHEKCALISNKKLLLLALVGILISIATVSVGVNTTNGFIREVMLARQNSDTVHILDKIVETYVVCYDGKEYFVPYRGSVSPVYIDNTKIKECSVAKTHDKDDEDIIEN